MKRSTWKKRALASALALTMAASVLPMAGFAAGGTSTPLASESGTDGLEMHKTAKLEDDGTYTINLEAWATGQVEVETITKVKPCDIVLVLDQSGSMKNEEYYISGIPNGRYTEVNETVSIEQVKKGGYYYRVDGKYYRLRVEQETLETTTTWVGADGMTYAEEQVSNTWTDYYGNTWAIDEGGYYAVPTLKTFHRVKETVPEFFWERDSYFYQNDEDPSDKSSESRFENWARQNFLSEFGKAPFAAQAKDTNGQFAGAQYIPVTQQTTSTDRYTFYYTDANGTKVTVDTYEGTETDTCPVSRLYTQNTTTGPRLDALKYAANTFIDNIRANAIANEVNHRVAVVGFASNSMSGTQWEHDEEFYWCNTELFVGSTQYNYARNGAGSNGGDVASNHYDEAFQNVLTSQGYTNLEKSIESLDGNGATYPQYGFDMAEGIFNAYGGQTGDKDRSRVVIFLTDGEPGASGYNKNAADAAVNAATNVKGYNAKVYTVAVLSSAPEQDSGIDNFLKNTSSDGSYTLATNAQDLENFFETVNEDISDTTSTVKLTEEALLKDVLGEDFIFPENYDVNSNVTVRVAPYEGDNHFGTAETADGVNVELDGNTINVTGFDYVATENLVTENGGTDKQPTGNKLIVTIEGVLARDSAAGKEKVSTNSETSGIYDKDKAGGYAMVKPFPMPQVTIGHSLHVLDYAKEAQLPVDGLAPVNRLDSSKDSVFSKVGVEDTKLNDMTYGNAKVADGMLSYEPKTMNWDNYDSFYALGKNGDINQWSKVSVMPANNVYYEDDFITTKDGSTVGIEYTGDWKEVFDNTEDCGNNTETPNNGIHGGWVEGDTGLSNDTGYSDGSAQMASGKATAKFTFTGTGVDVYTRTNISTLTVMAQLVDGNGKTQTLIMNNKAENGDYYQIPTLSFADLAYGTYTVTIYVSGSSGTYYLDGIRVYNPIQGLEEDEVVKDAYADELGATFKEVRDILLGAAELAGEDMFKGALFLDKNHDGTQVVGEYKDYGPKNEVYLGKDQSVAFKVDGTDPVYVGLKAPEGHATVQMTNANAKTDKMPIDHSTDLYYKVVPNSDGQIVITNVGEGLLSITKLRTTGVTTVGEASVEALLSYVNTMDTLPEVPYGNEGSNGSEDGGNVDIENPDQGQETPNQGNSFLDIVKDIFESIWNLF